MMNRALFASLLLAASFTTTAAGESCLDGASVPDFAAPGQIFSDVVDIASPGDEAWFVLTVDTPFDEGLVLRIETISDTPEDPIADDTRLWFYDGCDESTGEGVSLSEFDDDSGAGLTSRIDTRCLVAGTYYLKVNGWEETSIAENVTLEVEAMSGCEAVGPDPSEPDGDRDHATRLEPGDSPTHTIAPAGDEDWRYFELETTRRVRISAPGAHEQAQIELFYASPNVPVAGLCNNTGDPSLPPGTISTDSHNGCNVDTDCPDNINPVPALPDCIPWSEFPDEGVRVDPADNPLVPAAVDADALVLCLPSTMHPSPSDSVQADPADPFYWFVRVRGVESEATFAYDLLLEDLGPCDFEALDNGAPGLAQPVELDQTISGIFDYSATTPNRDDDFFAFEPPADPAAVVEIVVESASITVDSLIELFVGPDEDGAYFLLADAGGGEGSPSRLELSLPDPTATYRVNVTAANVVPNFPYDVAVRELKNVFSEVVDYADSCLFNPISDVPSRFLASIDLPGTCDYDGFRFRIPTDRDVTIVTNSTGDTTIQLLNCYSEEILGCDDDSNSGCASGYCSQISGCLPGPHEYCVRVRPFSGGSVFDYELEVQDNGDCTAQDPPVVTSDMNNACGDPSGADFNDRLGCESNYDYFECFASCPPYEEGRCTLVTMEQLSAHRTSHGIEIAWTTASEIDTAGFRVFREELGSRVKSGPFVISPFITASGSELVGATYYFIDTERRPAKGVRYWVEDLDLFGRTTRHGPIVITTLDGERSAPGR